MLEKTESVEDQLDWSATVFSAAAGGARFGGDWCDAFAISVDTVALTIGDVAGHGESAAETMRLVRTTIFKAIGEGGPPSKVLRIANTAAYQAHGGNVIVTAVVAILNRQHRTLAFANAGHPPPVVVAAHGHAFLSNGVGDLPLGMFPKHRAADHVVAIPIETLIAFYTDGITEHSLDILHGERELVAACRAVYDSPAHDSARAIARLVFQNVRGCDDAAVLAVRTSDRARQA